MSLPMDTIRCERSRNDIREERHPITKKGGLLCPKKTTLVSMK